MAGGIRVENHLLPAVSNGPLDPTWSPDGQSLALLVDNDGNLDIGVVEAVGGGVTLLTTHPHVDVELAIAPVGGGAREGVFWMRQVPL